jgi:hypothetical protein
MPFELEFEDRFEAAALELRRWFPYYLSLEPPAASAVRYEVGGGRLRLLIEAGQEPWCPEFDGRTASGRFSTDAVVREEHRPVHAAIRSDRASREGERRPERDGRPLDDRL